MSTTLIGYFVSIVGESYNVPHPNGNNYDTVTCEYETAGKHSFLATFNFPIGTSWINKLNAIPQEHGINTSFLARPQKCHGARCNV